jgi:predicted component of type VI protein secretion system
VTKDDEEEGPGFYNVRNALDVHFELDAVDVSKRLLLLFLFPPLRFLSSQSTLFA